LGERFWALAEGDVEGDSDEYDEWLSLSEASSEERSSCDRAGEGVLLWLKLRSDSRLIVSSMLTSLSNYRGSGGEDEFEHINHLQMKGTNECKK
jgi:hypothetical protein